jgi:ABC-type nitrate/sulfonate/bicarbonate transport system permease component
MATISIASASPAPSPAPRRPRRQPRWTLAGYLTGFASMFLLWHAAATWIVPSVLFPAPAAVAVQLVNLVREGVLLEHVYWSLQRIMLGFCIGSVIGVTIGLLMGSFRPVRVLLEPFTEFLRFIPSVAMITIAVIWFGIGEESKVFLIIYTTVFIVIIATAAGVAGVDRDKVRAARSLGANRRQVFFHVTIPATVPAILTGMRIAMANSFTTIVAAELVASNEGLGKMLWDARMFMLVEDIFVALVCLGAMGFAVDRLFRWATVRFAGRYAPVV